MNKLWGWLIVLLGVAIFFSYDSLFRADRVYDPVDASALDLKSEFNLSSAPPYVELEREYRADRLPTAAGPTAAIAAADYAGSSGDADIRAAADADTGSDVLEWNSETGWVEWEVDVREEGLYNLEVAYKPAAGGFSAVVRGIQVDGQYPFAEAQTVVFPRLWKDAKFPYDRNRIGQEIRPAQLEIGGWQTVRVTDYTVSSEPLLWHFTAGTHKIRLIGVRESVSIGSLRLAAPASLPAYADYAKAHETPAAAQGPWYQLVEAERFKQKSSTSIQTKAFSQARISPDPKGRVVYNTLGGDRWKTPGDWVEWEIEVPRDGFYVLELKYLQMFQSNTKMYRTLEVDGAVPFREMLHYTLPWNNNFRIAPLQDEQGAPYRFYLAQGKHTLRLIADSSPVAPAAVALDHAMRELNAFGQSIRKITGNYGGNSYASKVNFDTSRTWDLKTYMPDIDARLQGMIDNFQLIAAYFNGLNASESDMTSSIDATINTLRRFQANVNKIPGRIQDFDTMQNSMGTWLGKAYEQPVMLDYLVVRTPDAVTGLKEPTFLGEIGYTAVNFFRSFYLQYDMRSLNKEEAVTVWINRGRDYVNLLQEKIAQDFTAKTGIEVNLNQMPNPNQLILGNAAGEQPDVALGITNEMPVDFAMRGAVADLSQFPGFAEAVGQFNPGAMRSLQYNGGTYALPEVQYFPMLFYRTDLFDQLGLEPPDTWEDVYAMLPSLQENGMTFYYPKDFFQFLFQNGADVYGPDGLRTVLEDERAMKAFKAYTDLYAKYDLPLDVPSFYNHFRNGDMPVGIADYNTFIQLSVAAPEIKGRWKMLPVPGTRQPDGTVARWTQQVTYNGMIMQKSDKQEEAWQFLKWWTSAEVQTRYGLDMESYYGPEYRWNSANLQALVAMPWSSQERQAIEEQERWVKNVPVLPGYYYLGRELEFAWNRAVLGLGYGNKADKMPAKEALEKSVVSLQREMDRKQRDLDIPPDADLQVPQITSPYEWRSPR